MGDSKRGKAFGDQWLGSMWFKILFRKAIAIFSLISEAVPENVRSIPSESGIGRKGWFRFPLVCGQYKIWAIMASLNFLSKSPLHWEGYIVLRSCPIESLSDAADGAAKTIASILNAGTLCFSCIWWERSQWKLSSIYKYLQLFHTHLLYNFKRGMGLLVQENNSRCS